MIKSFKLFLAMLLIGGFALSFSSCKDSEKVSDDPNSPEHISLSKESEPAMALSRILSYTSELDSLPDNWASNSYTVEPTVGIVNDEATPYVRYIPVLNKQEAIDKYNSITGKTISEDATSDTWKIDNIGGVVFNVLDQSDVTATLDINIKQQPHLTQIRFVPASALGTNTNIGGEPYYTFGDIVKLTEGDNTSYWICARPCSQLKRKGKSHWLSFNLNKLGLEKSNFTKFTKSGFYDYILPTDLGNEAGSLEHLQNLIKVLAIIDEPGNAEKMSLDTKGLGGLSGVEFDRTKRIAVSNFWEDNNYWQTVLPGFFSRRDFQEYLYKSTRINVFYHGHSYYDTVDKFFYETKPSVWIAQISPTTFKKVASGVLKWTRTPKAVDFSNTYAEYGSFLEPEEGLPETGLVVRYKTGAQLVGKTGDDEAPLESFTVKHNNTIEDIYVFKNTNKEVNNDVVMGDLILSDKKDEVCVVSPSKANSSYADFISSSSDQQPEPPSLETAIPVYFHILNTLIYHSDLYKKYTGPFTIGNMFSEPYIKGIKCLYAQYKEVNQRELSQDVHLQLFTKGKNMEDREEITEENQKHLLKKLELFSIHFPYKERRSDTKFKIANITYNLTTKEYAISKGYTTADIDENDYIYKQDININSYKVNKNMLLLDPSQTFERTISGAGTRDEVKQAAISFYDKNSTNF